MSLWDTLFGDELTRKALADKAYLDPQGIKADPKIEDATARAADLKARQDAATSAASRMEWSRGLGSAAQAISQANMKGGKWGDLLAAGAGGLTQGGDDFLKQRYVQAQTREAQAKARKYEAEASPGNRPGTVRDANGRVMRWNGKRYVGVPQWEQDGYAKVDLPPMPYDYNPDQGVIDPTGKGGGQVQTPDYPGSGGGGMAPKGMRRQDTDGTWYVSRGGRMNDPATWVRE